MKTTDTILTTLNDCSLTAFADRVAAMSARFDKVAQEAANRYTPQAKMVRLLRRTLKDEAEIEAWLKEVEQELHEAIQHGPVIVR